MRTGQPAPTDGEGLDVARERFLTADSAQPDGVRDTILASWWRSRSLKVDADRIQLPYIRDPESDTPLTRSAEPVLRTLRDQLEGQQVSILLTDSSGLVLVRLTAGDELERHLDKVQLAPGFSYAEQFVGTNGIGTALEGGRPMHVFGHEHYAEHLENLACAGVPIHHPISGKTVGAVDLTCWRRDAGSLLLTLAKSTAEQIRQALLADAGIRELELFHEYLRVCRRTTGIVFAVDNDVAMMNDLARTVLDPADQAALLGHGADALAGRPDRADPGRAAHRRHRPADRAAGARRQRPGRGAGQAAGAGGAAGPAAGHRDPGGAARAGRLLPAVAAGLRRGGEGVPGRRVAGGRGRGRRRQGGGAARGAAAPAAGGPAGAARRGRVRPPGLAAGTSAGRCWRTRAA